MYLDYNYYNTYTYVGAAEEKKKTPPIRGDFNPHFKTTSVSIIDYDGKTCLIDIESDKSLIYGLLCWVHENSALFLFSYANFPS